MLHLILGLMLATQPETPKKLPPSKAPPPTVEPKLTQKEIEKVINEDAMGASVVSVGSDGDLVIFDGAITVPAARPSVEECGVLMSMSPKERPQELAAQRKKADQEAYSRQMSTRERMTYVQKAMEPKRECQALFKRKCDEIKQRVPVDARKKAVADAKTSIDRLLVDAKLKSSIQTYMTNVLAECRLEE